MSFALRCALVAMVVTGGMTRPVSAQNAPDSQNSHLAGANPRKPSERRPCPSHPENPASAPAPARFPYPGEAPTSPPGSSAPEELPPSQAPAPQPDTTAKRFPYPGDSSTPSSSNSDSSSSSSSSSRASGPESPAPDEAGSEGSVRRKLPKPQRIQSDEDREAEDLTVAKFYRQSGNLQAAYLRAKDAVKVQPDDPEAHFALAEVAQRLDKKAEAEAEFRAYLKLDPDGDRVKAAQKALASIK